MYTISLKKNYLLPLICAAAASRSENHLRNLILVAKKKKIFYSEIYEALLQNYLFTGYPSAMISLKILREYFIRIKIKNDLDMNLFHFRNRGEITCRKIYGNKFEKLISNVKDFSPDLASWLVLEGYGKVLGRKGLALKQRELCIISVLSILKFEDQLYSHINGAIKIGVPINDVNNVILNLRKIGKNCEAKFGEFVLKKYKENKGIL